MTNGHRATGRGRVPGEGGPGSATERARERFLGAIAERIAPERIAELHLFPPIRQGGMESGIAVIAAYPEPGTGDETARGSVPAGEAPWRGDAGPPPRHQDDISVPAEPHRTDAAPDSPAHVGVSDEARERLTVYRATYRWARKGPERGRWEVDVRAEADAPLTAVEDIVRGVHRRAGGEAEPERLSAAAVRAALGERPWTSAT